jgi:hypothetical protein
MEKEKITTETRPEATEQSNEPKIQVWTVEDNPVKRALKKPLLWYLSSALNTATA